MEQLDTYEKNNTIRRLTQDDIVVYDRITKYLDPNTIGQFESCLREVLQILDNDNRKVVSQKYAGMGCIWFLDNLIQLAM